MKLTPEKSVPMLNTQNLNPPAEPSTRGTKSTRKKNDEETKQSPNRPQKLQISKLSMPMPNSPSKQKTIKSSVVIKVDEDEPYMNAKTFREQKTARRQEMRETADGSKTNRGGSAVANEQGGKTQRNN